MSENTERIRERVLALVESEFESDAEFEREMGIAAKTVNNWRRMRSSSFMKMLPALSERFGVHIGDLYDMPIRKDTSELSEEELRLLHLYRKTRALPKKLRVALAETLEQTINLYVTAAQELKESKKRR